MHPEDDQPPLPNTPAERAQVALLNRGSGVPSDFDRFTFGGDAGADTVLLDFNYHERARASAWILDLLARGRRDGARSATQTLLLAARGLDPVGPALLEIVRQFARHHVFVELWNGVSEVHELAAARLDHLYVLPVTAALSPRAEPEAMPARPGRNVFVSLGGDDELDLLAEVVRRRPDLRFFVPDQSWRKSDTATREAAPVRIAGPNVTSVPCNPERRSLFTEAYQTAYAESDTVLIATAREKAHQMRGGIRVADALRSQKRVVMTRNALCELLMAQHDRTCLVTERDAGDVAGALERMMDGTFRADAALYEPISALTRVEEKLSFIVRAPTNPAAARRSPFFRDGARLERDLERLLPGSIAALGPRPVLDLLGVARGASIDVPGVGVVRVAAIVRSSEARHELTIERAGGRALTALHSSDPRDPCFRKTRRGHALAYRGTDLAPAEEAILLRLAALL